ncbi:MAG: methyltransferase domain-containing protein [Myxococcota bacterium]
MSRAEPLVGLFLFDCGDAETVRRLIEQVPPDLHARLHEVVVMDDRVGAESLPDLFGGETAGKLDVVVHRNPREHGFGGARKAAFEYARLKRLDWVVCLRADVDPPVHALSVLVDALRESPDTLLLASRRAEGGLARRPGAPLWRRLAHGLWSGFLNRTLGLRIADYGTSFRAVPTRFLDKVPYLVNADDRQFDVHLLIQARALGAPVREVPVAPSWNESEGGRDGLVHALRTVGTAVGYRLHQLHLIRRGRYFVDEGVHYTLKHSESSSHMQIVEAIAEGARVLDLGCSQGLLAAPLAGKGVSVVGVDVRSPDEVALALAEYYQRDLEEPLELPTGRSFDYVVCSDVIEHLRQRTELLRSARRYLREGGRLIISTPNVALWFYRLSLLIGRFEYGPRGVLDETHVHLFTRASFRRLVEKAGFHVVSERVTALPFEVVFESTGRSRLVRGISRFYHALARLWPGLFAYQIILEAEIITLDEESTWSS